jgi:hypothetical protein
MNRNSNIDRKDFMAFFRDDEKLKDLSADDRLEIFRSILIGSSDFSKALLNEVLGDYGVETLEVFDSK